MKITLEDNTIRSNSCFGSIKCITILLQAITGEHECRKVTATYLFGTRAHLCYRLKKGRTRFYQPEKIVASLLLLMVLTFKVIFHHTLKQQFIVLHFHNIKMFWKMFLLTLKMQKTKVHSNFDVRCGAGSFRQ